MEDIPFTGQAGENSQGEGGQGGEEEELPHLDDELDPLPAEEGEEWESFEEASFPELDVRQMLDLDEEHCFEVLEGHPGWGGGEG